MAVIHFPCGAQGWAEAVGVVRLARAIPCGNRATHLSFAFVDIAKLLPFLTTLHNTTAIKSSTSTKTNIMNNTGQYYDSSLLIPLVLN